MLGTHSGLRGSGLLPGVGPEHACFKEPGRPKYVAVTDLEALAAFQLLSELEGIIPALESAHAVAHALKIAPQMGRTPCSWSTSLGAAIRT